MHTFIDLFAGIGGFRLGLEAMGLECVFASEIDPIVSACYRRSFDTTVMGDIKAIHANQVPSHDVLCAGFPCQPFSSSGRQQGFDDLRGTLFFEIIRIAEHHKPKVLFLENVPSILTVQDKKIIRRIKEEIGALGYDLHLSILDAGHFGVPQHRPRVYFVALLRGAGLSYREPQPTYMPVYLRDMLESPDLVDPKLWVSEDRVLTRTDSLEQEPQLKTLKVGYYSQNKQGFTVYHENGLSLCQLATEKSGTGMYYTAGRVRRLMATEVRRLMGFPAHHVISTGIQGNVQLGNAVIPAMVSHVWSGIRGDSYQETFF